MDRVRSSVQKDTRLVRSVYLQHLNSMLNKLSICLRCCRITCIFFTKIRPALDCALRRREVSVQPGYVEDHQSA